MSRRSAAILPAEFDDSSDPASLAATLSAMEMGDCERQQHQHQEEQEIEDRGSRVIVAATEARNQESEDREGVARAHRFLAEVFRVLLTGLVAVFGCYFAFVWVDSFRKGRFSHTLGLVTVTFCGLIVCAWASRRRLGSMTQLPERVIPGGSMQRRPKGVLPRAQQRFQYFVYPELSSSSSGSETSIASSDDASGISFSSTTFKASAGCANDMGTLDDEPDIIGDGGDAEIGDSAKCSNDLPAITMALAEEAIGENCSVNVDDEMTPSPVSPPSLSPLKRHPESECQKHQEVQDALSKDVEGLEQQRQEAHGDPKTAEQEESSSWADCSVCLEAFSGGDSACRTPCGHVFHTECINNWLDQNHSCPECRLDLFKEDGTDTDGELRLGDQAPESSPASTLPDEAFQISFSNRGFSSSSLSTAPEQLPTTVASNRTTTASLSTHPEAFEAINPESSDCALVARTADLPPADVQDDAAEFTTVIDSIDSDGNARGEAPATVAAPKACSLGSPHTRSPSSLASSNVHFQDVSQEPERPRRTFPPSRSITQTLGETTAKPQPCSAALDANVLGSPNYEAPTSPATFARQLQQFAANSGRSLIPPTSAHTTEDVTDLNTAINAIPYHNSASAAAVAPYACYFGSPQTQSSSSPRTPVVRFLGTSPDFGERTPSGGASGAEHTTAPYASFFNSPGSPSSPSPVSTAIVPFRGSPSGAAAAAAPYACYLDSPPCSPSPLSTTNLVEFRFSPEFVRLHGAADTRGFRGVPALSPMPPPSFGALSFPQGTSHLPRIGVRSSNPSVMARTHHRYKRQQQADVLQEDRDGQAHLPPPSTRNGQPQHVQVHQVRHGRIQEAAEAASPPRPPPRLVQRRSPGFAGGDQWSPPPPPPPLSFPTPVRSTGGQQNIGTSSNRPSPQLVRGGGTGMRQYEAGSGAGRGGKEGGVWVWPVGSDPVWDNKTRVKVGNRIRISSLDEGADVSPQQGEWRHTDTHHNDDGLVAARRGGDIGGRWVWQPEPTAHQQHRPCHQHQDQHQRQQDHSQMRYHNQYGSSFEEESLPETEEHDERFWDRVMYHIWA